MLDYSDPRVCFDRESIECVMFSKHGPKKCFVSLDAFHELHKKSKPSLDEAEELYLLYADKIQAFWETQIQPDRKEIVLTAYVIRANPVFFA